MSRRSVGFAAGFLGGLAAGGAAVYGVLVETEKLRLRSLEVPLKGWRVDGFRIALLGDLHVRDRRSALLAYDACVLVASLKPDVVVLAGDFVGRWRPGMSALLTSVLAPLAGARVLTVPGNHDYDGGDAALLEGPVSSVGGTLLRNEVSVVDGVTFVGLDSARMGQAAAAETLGRAGEGPRVLLWHEPDMVDSLAPGSADLMLSGHSHGGQFRFPGGVTPMRCKLGKKYHDGWYPSTPVPLVVTTGVGTTGPPMRFLLPPEVMLLTLRSS